jgi:AraC family transcriptional regulator
MVRDEPGSRYQNRARRMTLVHAVDVRCMLPAEAEAVEEASAHPTLVLPRRGVFRYHGRMRTVVADANTVLLFHPGEPYRITHPTDEGDDCTALRFDSDAVTDALGAAGDAARAWILDARTHRAIHRWAACALQATDELERDEAALEILTAVGRMKPVVPAARDVARLEGVRERIAAGVHEQTAIAALARDAGLSPFHLARRFRAWTGSSLHQYRLALRLGLARTRIRDGANDMTRLALDLGFATPAHFSASFRKSFGCTPTEARRGT